MLNNFDSILIDTNFFFVPFQFGVDVVGRLREKFPSKDLFTLEACYEELKKQEEKEVDLALKYIEEEDIGIRDSGFKGSADEQILKYAEEHDVAVCTQDKPLRDKLRERNIRTIVLRSYSTLEVI